jgi:catechol 2,3-dioxygenase-like lactoylglutathione lyase family enzyme
MIATVNTLGLTHGTLEQRKLDESHAFYREFLGLNAVCLSERGQYVWSGGEWIVVCLAGRGGGERREQGAENSWRLSLGGEAEVRAAHAAAVRDQDKWKIRSVSALEDERGGCAFTLQDLDGNWWRIDARPVDYYDRFFKAQ